MDTDDAIEVVPNGTLITHARDVREAPIEVKNSNELSCHSGNAPADEDVSETENARGHNSHETVIIDEVHEDSAVQPMWQNDNSNFRHVTPSAPAFDDLPDYGKDIEEQMIRAAIEASKRDVEELSDPGPWHNISHSENAAVEEAVSMSLMAAEQEKALCEQGSCAGTSEVEASKPDEEHLVNMQASSGRLMEGSSSIQGEAEDGNEQRLVRPGSRESANEVGVVEPSSPSSPGQQGIGNLPLNNGNAFPSDEWGGICSAEHDGQSCLRLQCLVESLKVDIVLPMHLISSFNLRAQIPGVPPRPPSPSLAAQRLIREQQDDEYNEALQADREKELKAIQQAEVFHLEEEAARKAAHEEQQRKQECERQLAVKEASLPQEPSANEKNAVNLPVRMPDGSRRGRLFLKSDRLHSLFGYIDIGRGVKQGTYRLVRPYPRRAFGDGESSLTNKQEALFLELV
ncbi:plant UBX domain-containing protein 8-like [Hibiscus syriacus]|uniref:plant UBX domain-containing protein 8-like n=1 Tax=Hibiscus syriacus TaxID=106335 RepID=UPI0019238969|nr:plant UBX domain-containing protein 8-like [Hibiscus syriacus]